MRDKISFDFDDTLTNNTMEGLAKIFVALGDDVYICTYRNNEPIYNIIPDNSDLFEVADRIGIPRENIIFTSFNSKVKYLKDFTLHIDDCEQTIRELESEIPSLLLVHYNKTIDYLISKLLKK